jgi:hypothetical protein
MGGGVGGAFDGEVLYSGVTGEPLDGPVFIGCVFYQRLRHLHRVPKKKGGWWFPLYADAMRPWSPTRFTRAVWDQPIR